MTGDRELTRRVGGLTAAGAALLAAGAGAWGGAAEAAGVLLGSAVLLANFAGLAWATDRALRVGAPGATHPALWLASSAVRLGLIGLALGLAASRGWVGPGGLLLSLAIVPVTVVVAGLRSARTA